MTAYSYRALDQLDHDVTGRVDAPNRKLALTRLKELGLRPCAVEETAAETGATAGVTRWHRRVKPEELGVFTRQLATLLGAGLPLLRALRILEEQTESEALQGIIRQLGKAIQGGASFSEALQAHPTFSRIYIGMVRAGEAGGVLEVVLDRLATFAEKDLELRTRIRGALTYPAIMGLVATGVVVFLLVFVIPTFAKMFADMNVELPLPTRLVIALSTLIREWWYLLVGGAAGVAAGYRQLAATDAGRLWLDGLKLRVPVFGELNRKVATARFTRTLSTLLQAGVPILLALEIVKDITGNEVIARAVTRVSASITEGETVSGPLHEAGIFAPLVTHMIAVGEETGSLETMLARIADQYEMIVDETVGALATMLEPLLIVFMGVSVGLIVTALFFPMFEMFELVGK